MTSQKTKRSPSVIWNGCFLSLHIFTTQLTRTSWNSLQFAVSEEVNSPASHVFAVWRHYSTVTLTMIDVRQRHPKERASHHWLSIDLKDKPTEACFKNSSLSSLGKQKELRRFQSKVGNLHPFISLTKTSLTKPTHVLPSSQKQEEKKNHMGSIWHSKHPKASTERQITPLSPSDLSDFTERQHKAEVCARMWKIPREVGKVRPGWAKVLSVPPSAGLIRR